MRAAVALIVFALVVSAAPAPVIPAGVLAPLRPGQPVGLTDEAGGFVVTVVPGVEGGHRVVEVGTDFVVVEDVVGVTQTRIPVTSIKCVRVIRVPGR